MTVGIYRAAMALVGHERHLDSIASNLANVGTTGFKRARTAAHEFTFQRPGRQDLRGVQTESRTDFGQGDVLPTQHPYDLALSGPGFFALDGPSGELYTRDGEFRLTDEGVLVNRDGYPLSWDLKIAGIDPEGLPIVVNGDGSVRQGDLPLGNLRIVDFDRPQELVFTREGLWYAPPGVREQTATARVYQHALEQSNSVGTEELIELIGVQRSFESAANVIQSLQRSYARLTRSA